MKVLNHSHKRSIYTLKQAFVHYAAQDASPNLIGKDLSSPHMLSDLSIDHFLALSYERSSVI